MLKLSIAKCQLLLPTCFDALIALRSNKVRKGSQSAFNPTSISGIEKNLYRMASYRAVALNTSRLVKERGYFTRLIKERFVFYRVKHLMAVKDIFR